MDKVLIAVDGSEAALRAVYFVVTQTAHNPQAQINLLNVQEPPPAQIRLESGISDEEWHVSHQEAGRRVLASAEQALEKAKRRFNSHVAIGQPVHEIVERASELGCSQIVMGTRGMSALGSLVLGSVANRVVHLAQCPVTLVK
jgi:nucleotide-binding universal stress UspA family protein